MNFWILYPHFSIVILQPSLSQIKPGKLAHRQWQKAVRSLRRTLHASGRPSVGLLDVYSCLPGPLISLPPSWNVLADWRWWLLIPTCLYYIFPARYQNLLQLHFHFHLRQTRSKLSSQLWAWRASHLKESIKWCPRIICGSGGLHLCSPLKNQIKFNLI